MAGAQVASYVTAFPYDEVAVPLMDAQRYIYNLEPLLQTIAEFAEVAENDASSGNAAGAERKLERLKRLTWIALEERLRCEDAIFAGDGVLTAHIEHRIKAN